MRITAWIALSLLAFMSGCSGCEPEVEPAPLEPAAADPAQGPATLKRIGKEAVVPVPPPERRPALDAPEELVAELDWRLDHSDPDLRVEAVEALEPEGAGLRVLTHLLETDPDPLVRTAAAEQLETSPTPEAVGALVTALGDPQPEVVLAAIESLEFVADERIIAQLSRYRNHPDPEVREAVEDAIDFLE